MGFRMEKRLEPAQEASNVPGAGGLDISWRWS